MKIVLKVKDEPPRWFSLWFERVFGHQDAYLPSDVARRLGRSPHVVYRAIRSGNLGALRLGPRTYVIPRPALVDWLCRNLNLIQEDS